MKIIYFYNTFLAYVRWSRIVQGRAKVARLTQTSKFTGSNGMRFFLKLAEIMMDSQCNPGIFVAVRCLTSRKKTFGLDGNLSKSCPNKGGFAL